MISLLLILIPFLGGLIAFFIPKGKSAKGWALLSSVATLAIAVASVYAAGEKNMLSFDVEWLPQLGSRFTIGLDGMGKMLCLLTAIALPVVFITGYKNDSEKPGSFYGLMLWMQAGLMGVFLSMDCLLFYFFWELALIPAYFLCSKWGRKKNCGYFQVFYLHIYRIVVDAGWDFVCLF